ncbi:MAG TPA: xanthine dehydrogenase accessory protein XdhC [Polyangiaceae bacterium]|nr:xanthine dehydrogenase accessory protein XdhC [Polyangiaceae bacterium]
MSDHEQPGGATDRVTRAAHPAIQGGVPTLAVARETVAVLSGERGEAAAVATVIGRSGSAPQIMGAKLLLHPDGSFVGTVGGGAIEAQVLDACRAALRDGRSRRVEANLVQDLGMCCGGSMEVFVEHITPQARLLIIGGGHIAQALVPVAQSAGFAVHVYDDRDEMLESPVFADIETGAFDVDELDAAIPDLSDRDWLLIITRDHARDEKALAALMRRPHRYLGMIGSRRKVHTVLARILRRESALGRPAPDLSRVRAPIGLDLGGRTPGEIAVSIVAELVQERHGGSGNKMSVVAEAAERVRTEILGEDATKDDVAQ